MLTYPVCLVGLEQRRTVIIGGGKVAARKAQALLDAGASITAISPEFCPDLLSLVKNTSRLAVVSRAYQFGDLEGAFLVIAATDDLQVNQAVWEEAQQRGCLVNVVDDPLRSNFIVPAVVERGAFKIAITTGGSSPALARRMREKLERLIGPEYTGLVQILGELRPELQRRFDPGDPRLQAALHLIDADLLEILRTQGMEAARKRALELILSIEEGAG